MRKTAVWTPLQSNGCIIWRTLVSKIRKMEDAAIQKSEHRGQKELHGLEGTFEQNDQCHRGKAEENWRLRHSRSNITRHRIRWLVLRLRERYSDSDHIFFSCLDKIDISAEYAKQ